MTDQTKQRDKNFYKSLPKIELHRHLEGSIRLNTMVEIAREYDLDLPYNSVELFRPMVQVVDSDTFDFKNFLSKFTSIRYFFQSPELIKRIAQEAVADAAADNIRYLELRFTPVALTRVGEYPLGEAMDWVIEAVDEASKQYGITTRLIASVNRHESVDLAEEVANLAIERKHRGIVAMDLAGSESEFPGEEFAGVFSTAHQAGLFVTIHAGEWGGPELISLAVEQLHAERIGHGVRVLEDPNVTALARERGIAFEVCPTSNYQSGVFNSLESHPLARMIEAGLVVTINTDDPAISQIDLSNEYRLACETFKLDLPGLQSMLLNSANAAFLHNSEKETLAEDLKREFVIKLRD